MSKQVATKETFSSEVPAYMKGMNTNRGSEHVSNEDLSIPRIGLIQDLSPQHKPKKAEYIEGAAPGMLFNRITNELYGESLVFVPVSFRKEWVVWKDIDSGGGFKAAFDTSKEANEYMATLDDQDQCEVVDCAQHFVLIVDPKTEDTQEAVISMSKSQMKVSRKFNSQVRIAGGDRFCQAYKLSAVEDQNAAGQDYYNYSIAPLGYVSEKLYKKGEELWEMINSGQREINHGEAEVSKSAPEEADNGEFEDEM